MSRYCTSCGADTATQPGAGGFCTACGTHRVVAPSTGSTPAPLAKPTPAPAPRVPAADPWSPQQRPGPTPRPPSSPRRRPTPPALLALSVFTVTALVLGAGAWGLFRLGVLGDDATTTAAFGSSGSSEPGSSPLAGGSGVAPTASASPSSTGDAADEDDPLGLGTEQVDQPCDGQYLVVLASSGVPSAYRSTLAPAVEAEPDAHYLVTDQSCAAFNQQIDGQRIYAAYLGPFSDADQACDARAAAAVPGSYARVLDTGVTQRSLCACERGYLADLDRTRAADPDATTSLDVDDLQALLYRAGLNPDMVIDGRYGPDTEQMVRAFQRREGLPVDGRAGSTTTDQLLSWC